MNKYQDETAAQHHRRLADNAELRAKWLAGSAAAVTFGPAFLVFPLIELITGWTLPQMTTLEFIVFVWAGPSVLLWWGANYQGKQADLHREYAKELREEARQKQGINA